MIWKNNNIKGISIRNVGKKIHNWLMTLQLYLMAAENLFLKL
jgi:hypothetical protein